MGDSDIVVYIDFFWIDRISIVIVDLKDDIIYTVIYLFNNTWFNNKIVRINNIFFRKKLFLLLNWASHNNNKNPRNYYWNLLLISKGLKMGLIIYLNLRYSTLFDFLKKFTLRKITINIMNKFFTVFELSKLEIIKNGTWDFIA